MGTPTNGNDLGFYWLDDVLHVKPGTCPYPIDGRLAASACIAAGTCGCDESNAAPQVPVIPLEEAECLATILEETGYEFTAYVMRKLIEEVRGKVSTGDRVSTPIAFCPACEKEWK
jgi:hypothetical protein